MTTSFDPFYSLSRSWLMALDQDIKLLDNDYDNDNVIKTIKGVIRPESEEQDLDLLAPAIFKYWVLYIWTSDEFHGRFKAVVFDYETGMEEEKYFVVNATWMRTRSGRSFQTMVEDD